MEFSFYAIPAVAEFPGKMWYLYYLTMILHFDLSLLIPVEISGRDLPLVCVLVKVLSSLWGD